MTKLKMNLRGIDKEWRPVVRLYAQLFLCYQLALAGHAVGRNVRDDDMEAMLWQLWQALPAQSHRELDAALAMYWDEHGADYKDRVAYALQPQVEIMEKTHA